MLVEQAVESFLIWRGVLPPTQPVLAELRGSCDEPIKALMRWLGLMLARLKYFGQLPNSSYITGRANMIVVRLTNVELP